MADGTIKILTDLSTEGFKKGLSTMGSLAKTGLSVVSSAMTATGTALVGLAGYAAKVGSSFESGMSEVAAISGATGKDLEALTAKAKEMGSTTKFSATESAEALKYMAMAGWDTDKMLSGLPGVMNLAAASGENLGMVSDIVTDSMTAFGISADKSTHFADVLAQTASKSNTSVALMGETFKYVAPVAGALGYSIEDTSVAIGLMANAGIKGSQSGTALRSMLSRLAKPTGEVETAMSDLGISLTDNEGNMKAFGEVVGDMRKGFNGLSKEQQAQYAATLAGQEGMSGLLAIVTASDEDFQNLASAISASNGAAQAMADTMQDNLQGSVTIAKSALEGLGITVYENLQEPLRAAVDAGTGYINQLNEAFSHGLDSGIEAAGKVIADIAVKAAEMAPKMLDAGVKAILAFCSGLEKNSQPITKAAVEIGKTLVSGFTKIVPQVAKVGLKIITEFSKELFGSKIGSQVEKLGKAIQDGFSKISTAVIKAMDKIGPAVEKVGTVFISLATGAVTVLADGISFLVEHCDILIPALAAVATAFAAQAIISQVSSMMEAHRKIVTMLTEAEAANALQVIAASGALTAKEMIVGVLTGKITLATAAQTLWNAAMAAFGGPVGLVISAVAALGVGIAALCLMQEDEISAQERLNQSYDSLDNKYSDILGGMGEYQRGVQNATGVLDALNAATGLTAEKQQELAAEMDSVQQQINVICSTASAERRQLTDDEISSLEELIQKQTEIAQREMELYTARGQAAQTYASQIASSTQYTAAEFEAEAQSAAKSAQDSYNQRTTFANEYMVQKLAELDQEKAVTSMSADEYNSRTNTIIAAYQAEKDAAQEQMDTTNAILANGYAQRATDAQGWVDKNKELNAEEIALTSEYNTNKARLVDENHKYINESGRDAKVALQANREELQAIEATYEKKLADINARRDTNLSESNAKQIQSVMDMVTSTGLSYDELGTITSDMVDTFITTMALLPEEERKNMAETLAGMNMELTAGGDLIYTNAEGMKTTFNKAWTDGDGDSFSRTRTTVDGMSKISGDTTLTAPKMGEINNVRTMALAALSVAQGIFNVNPLYQTVYTRNVGISGNRPSNYAKGGVTRYAAGGVSPEIHKHAAGVFTKRTRLWDPVTGVNEYGEAGHEALLPLKTSVYNEIAKGIVRQLSPAKLAGMMSMIQSTVRNSMSDLSLQITAKADYGAVRRESPAQDNSMLDRVLEKMDAMSEKLEQLSQMTVLMDSEKVGELVTPAVNRRMGEIYVMDERGRF